MSGLNYSLCCRDEAGKLSLRNHSDDLSHTLQMQFLQWVLVLEENVKQNQTALLDIPCNEQWRMILFPLMDQNKKMYFAALFLTLQDVAKILASGWNIYHYLLNAAYNNLAETLLQNQEFSWPAECGSREQIIQTSLKELLGWQIIGNLEKGIQGVGEMLAGVPLTQWFSRFFLAVNPVKYRDEYTTIVSVCSPEGTWKYMSMEKMQNMIKNNPEPDSFKAEKTANIEKSSKSKICRLIEFVSAILLLGLGIYLAIFLGFRAENRVLRQRLDHAESQVRMLIDENENLYKTVESLKENISKIYSTLEYKPENTR